MQFFSISCNSCIEFCCVNLVFVLTMLNIEIVSAKIVHTFAEINIVRKALYNITKCTAVVAKSIQTIMSLVMWNKTMEISTLNLQCPHAKMQYNSRKSTVVLAIKCIRTDSDLLINVTFIA